MSIMINLEVEDVNNGDISYLKPINIENSRWFGDIQLYADYSPDSKKLIVYADSSNDTCLKSIKLAKAGDADAWSTFVFLRRKNDKNSLELWIQQIDLGRRSLTNLSFKEYKQSYKEDTAEIRFLKKKIANAINNLVDEFSNNWENNLKIIFCDSNSYEDNTKIF